jgi:UDP-glucose:(heptosyl)LPS alpha-1,3-glucosyltransferase
MLMTLPPCKIAVVIPKYGLVGGAEGFAAQLTERIALNPRYEIHVFANEWVKYSDRVTFHKVPRISFPKFLTTISFAWFAGRMIAKMGFDLVHAQDRIFSADIFTMHGIPHRLWVREVRKKHLNLYDFATDWVERRIVEGGRCRQFLAVSGLAKEKFRQAYGTAEPEKIQVIHPGVDAARFRKLDRELCRSEIRGFYGIGAHEVVVLFVSMNFHIKGLDRLIRALALLKSERPHEKFKLLIVGKGNPREYAVLAKKLNVSENIIFAGVMEKETLDRTYLACDIFSILSRFDTFGMVVLEAMSASLPVIISNSAGAKDLVRDGVNGFIVDGEADAAVVSGKIGMLFHSGKRLQMGQQARATALACTWEAAAKRIEDIYDTLLSNRQRVPT